MKLLLEDVEYINIQNPDQKISLRDDGTIVSTTLGQRAGKKVISIDEDSYFVKADGETLKAYLIDDDGRLDSETVITLKSGDALRREQEEKRAAEEAEAKARETSERAKIEGQRILEKIKMAEKEDGENAWFEELVPDSGKADTVAGELIRAIERIRYRDYNDGDIFYSGYGLETAGDSASYLADMGYEEDLIEIAENELEENDYTKALNALWAKITSDIEKSPELLATPNEVDSRSDYDSDMWEEYEPKFDFDIELPWDVQKHIDAGHISYEDFTQWIEDMAKYDLGARDAEVIHDFQDAWTITNLNKEAYNELDRSLNNWVKYYVEGLDEEYASDDEDDDEYEDEEE